MIDPFEGLPRNHFGVVLADPPWQFQAWSGKGTARAAENHYSTMTVDDIAGLPVDSLAAENCVLFMWVVWPSLPESLAVIERWGFKYKTCGFAWMKADVSTVNMFDDAVDAYMGLGYWTRANSEVCLLATRGKPKRLKADVRQGIIAPKREHSRKPDGVHRRIERLVSGPYLELFGRQQRVGWTVWGHQKEKFISFDNGVTSMTKMDQLRDALSQGWTGASMLERKLGWKPHTLRGAISTLAKKPGVTICRRRESGVTQYRIEVDGGAPPSSGTEVVVHDAGVRG